MERSDVSRGAIISMFATSGWFASVDKLMPSEVKSGGRDQTIIVYSTLFWKPNEEERGDEEGGDELYSLMASSMLRTIPSLEVNLNRIKSV